MVVQRLPLIPTCADRAGASCAARLRNDDGWHRFGDRKSPLQLVRHSDKTSGRETVRLQFDQRQPRFLGEDAVICRGRNRTHDGNGKLCLDVGDIHIDVPAVNYKEMRSTHEPEDSAKIRERVMRTRQTQLTRFSGSRERLYCNAQMSSRHIRTFCELSADCERLLERAMTQQGLSARAHDRILKVARTIADLEDTPNLEPKHIAEAIQYRSLDRTYWT